MMACPAMAIASSAKASRLHRDRMIWARGHVVGVPEPSGDSRGDHEDRPQRQRTYEQGRTGLSAGPYPGGVRSQRGLVLAGSTDDDDRYTTAIPNWATTVPQAEPAIPSPAP